MIDIHTHILPGIDDGAKTVEESVELLYELKQQGVTKVVATPHFYIEDQTVEEFLSARQNAYDALMQKIGDSDEYPEVILGAEVYFSSALSEIDITPFCISGTDYFILEMPYQNLTNNIRRQINNFINFCGKTPIFAHIERYVNFTSIEQIYEMLGYGVLAQMNTSSLCHNTGKRVAFKLIKNGCIHVVGTDTHNFEKRPPTFSFGKKLVCKKFGEEAFDDFQRKAEAILENKDYDTIISM